MRRSQRGDCAAAVVAVVALLSGSAQGASFTILGVVGGYGISPFPSVSADGSIVVGLLAPDFSSPGDVFIWDAENGKRELDVVLTSMGLDLSGWLLNGSPRISADGRTIVGYGYYDGQRMAYMTVLPEPATAILLGIGLAGLAVRHSTGPG